MISEIFYYGSYAITIGGYIVRNKDLIITSYNVADIARFSFYVADSTGLIAMAKKKLLKKYDNVIFLESTEDDDFVVVHASKSSKPV